MKVQDASASLPAGVSSLLSTGMASSPNASNNLMLYSAAVYVLLKVMLAVWGASTEALPLMAVMTGLLGVPVQDGKPRSHGQREEMDALK